MDVKFQQVLIKYSKYLHEYYRNPDCSKDTKSSCVEDGRVKVVVTHEASDKKRAKLRKSRHNIEQHLTREQRRFIVLAENLTKNLDELSRMSDADEHYC
jgi:hypothetical protein